MNQKVQRLNAVVGTPKGVGVPGTVGIDATPGEHGRVGQVRVDQYNEGNARGQILGGVGSDRPGAEAVEQHSASEANRERFKAAPARYEPAYGGWCAWAMVDGSKVEVDPKSFLVEEGRLFVFYDGFLADTRKKWLKKGGAELRPKADAAWRKIVEPPRPPPEKG